MKLFYVEDGRISKCFWYCWGKSFPSALMTTIIVINLEGSKVFTGQLTMKGQEEKSSKMLQCSHCTKEFRYNSEKMRHELSHFPHFECETCGKTFSFVSALRRHQKQHERTGSVQCKKCKRKFRDDVLLQRHIKYAHKGTFICEKCNSKFSSELALRTHMKTHRPEAERRFKCSYKGCTKTFNFSHHLKHHELTHTNSKQHYCSVCGKGFIQSHHLKTHLKSHDPTRRLCCTFPGCRKEFSTDYARKRHMATHKNQSDYSMSSDSNSCDVSTTIKEETQDSTSCPTCGQTILQQEYLIHLDKCKILKDSNISTDTNEVSVTIELIVNSKDCPNLIKISNEEEVLNTTVEEWPSSPFRPNNYEIITSEFNSENCLNCDTKVNDESEKNPSNNTQYFRNRKTKNDDNEPVILKVNSTDDYYKVNQRDMCEGCDCANICEAKITMYDVPNTVLPPKGDILVDIATNVENRNGIIKLKDAIDDDILRTDRVVANKNNFEDRRFVPFSTCKEVLGNCLVNGDGCLCARMMAFEDRAVLAQEIDDITPQPGLKM